VPGIRLGIEKCQVPGVAGIRLGIPQAGIRVGPAGIWKPPYKDGMGRGHDGANGFPATLGTIGKKVGCEPTTGAPGKVAVCAAVL